jgi:MoxR-like ATPase
MTDEAIDETTTMEEKDTTFDGNDTPNSEVQLPATMATINTIEKEWQEENAPTPTNSAVAPNPSTLTPDGRTLESIIGASAYANLEAIYENRGQNMADTVTISPLETVGHIEVQNDKEGNAKYLVFYDEAGDNITQTVFREMGISSEGNMTQVIGESALKFTQLMSKSNLSNQVEGANQWSPSSMGNALDPKFQNYLSTFAATQRRTQLNDQLKQLRALMLSLNDVFAFDDYRHLEAFMAAWMMKDSTCRLSGVPGTGKTTVIECAATLLANSYGYNTGTRICAPRDYELSEGDEDKVFNSNTSSYNIYAPTVFPNGQQYNISYGNLSKPEIKELWETWRFNKWQEPKSIAGNYLYAGKDASMKSFVLPSGSYLYNYEYLKPLTDSGREKVALPPEAFRNLLLNHYYADVPYNFDINDTNTWPEVVNGLIQIPEGAAKKRIVKPVKIMNAEGVMDFSSIIEIQDGEKSFPMQLSTPEMDKTRVSDLLNTITTVTNRDATAFIQDYLNKSGLDALYTDAGRNEGYWLREFLLETCYDSRANPDKSAGGQNYASISQEMIAEIGIAKVDYEKRADEVLYGMEIRETASFDPAKGAQVSTFDFEPTPRPIVTQPVKFFNEANRSKAGMEDAILGLIAEKKVEYRGREFQSPNFVAWMDTNPHQKGNDLAFTDRIDMELLFKSVSMGGRYNIMSGKGGGVPVLELVKKMAQTNAVSPLRFTDLRAMWDYIGDNKSGIQMVQPGGAYDGYRDVAAISVLFSQTYRVRNGTIPIGDAAMSWTQSPHESPLVDFSTTTNTTSSKGGGGTESPVLGKGKEAFAMQSDSGNSWQNPDHGMQLPAVFTRVLGFRFTNSLVKLARAFAFLRGKSYVSREDIVDAVPYVCAHRIGRSREGLSDTEGNTKGIPAEVAKSFAYNNEQEFLRELLVNGYLMRDVNVGQNTGASLLEMLDSFYERCNSILQSSLYAHNYEDQVLSTLQQVFSATFGESDSSLAQNLTPVHWHIATMVSESERKGNTQLRQYSVPEGNKTGYPEMYSYYLQKITSPISNPSLKGDSCLYDVMKTRVEILNNPNLFSDDKARLMTLCDSEISIMAGNLTEKGKANAIEPINNRAYSNNTLTAMGATPVLPLLSYGDTLGAWATITNTKPSQANVRSTQSGLAMSASMFTGAGDGAHAAMSGQQLKLVGRIQEGARDIATTDSIEYGRIVQQLSIFMNSLGTQVAGEGRLILNAANQEGNYAIDFTTFMNLVKGQIKQWSTPGTPEEAAERRTFSYLDNNNELQRKMVDFNGPQGYTGISACFRLPHAAIANLETGDYSRTSENATGPRVTIDSPIRTNTSGTYNLWQDTENDFLRLWINLCSMGEPEVVDGVGTFQTYIFSVAVTSNFGTYIMMPDDAELTDSEENLQNVGSIKLLPMNEVRCYSQGSFAPQTIYDAGNITKADREFWLETIGDILQPRQS